MREPRIRYPDKRQENVLLHQAAAEGKEVLKVCPAAILRPLPEYSFSLSLPQSCLRLCSLSAPEQAGILMLDSAGKKEIMGLSEN